MSRGHWAGNRCEKIMNNFNDIHIDYRYSSRRRSIGLLVTTAGRVVVTMPRGTSQADLVRVLDKHGAWIRRKVAERQAAWERLKTGEVHFLGEAFRLVVRQGASGAVSLNGKELQVTLAPGADLWGQLVAWYARRAFTLLSERVQHFGASMALKPGPLELKGWKRRWGECHPDGTLKFNWRLILCPPEVIDYVVVHELAHLKVTGHNPRFWGVVAQVLPDYAARRQWLNRQGSPLLLWRVES
jgi:predicted metal-dependent hydrolase